MTHPERRFHPLIFRCYLSFRNGRCFLMARKLIDASWWYTYPLNLFVYAKNRSPPRPPNQTQSPVVILNRCLWPGVRNLTPTAGWGVCFFGINCDQKSNSWAVIPKHQSQEVDFSPNSCRHRKWLIPFHAVWGLCWYIFVAFLDEVRHIQVCLGCVFSISELVGGKKCCEILVGDLGIVPKKDNLQNLWNSCGVRDLPSGFRKKIPKKATENNNNLRLRASWGRCPSSESLMMYCQAPEGRFQSLPF